MPTTSALQQIPLPTMADAPIIPSDMLAHVSATEKRVVMRFNDTAQRDGTITAPEDGMVVYLRNTKTFMFYNGTAWASLMSNAQSIVISPVDAISSGGQLTLKGAGSNKSWGIKVQGAQLVFRYDIDGAGAADTLIIGSQFIAFGTNVIFQRAGWNQPVLRSGSSAPSNALGVDGDWFAVI
jgi:hypothetical protein